MRALVFVAAAALALASCDAIQNPFAAKSAKPAPVAAPAAQAAAVPAAEPAPAVEAAAAPASAEAPAAPGAPAPPAIVRWSPNDWPKQEHRLAALVANAETRDTLGETHRVVNEADARRKRCTTRACIERAYADEEAWLRQWEGSGDVR